MKKSILIVSALLMIVTSCLRENTSYSASTIPLRKGEYTPLSEVSGRDCTYYLFHTIPLTRLRSVNMAMQKAKSHISGTNALVDVAIETYTAFWPFVTQVCTEVTGTAVSTVDIPKEEVPVTRDGTATGTNQPDPVCTAAKSESLDSEEANSGYLSVLDEIRKCYKQNSSKFRIPVRVNVACTGKVTSSVSLAAKPERTLGKCLSQALLSAKFPAFRGPAKMAHTFLITQPPAPPPPPAPPSTESDHDSGNNQGGSDQGGSDQGGNDSDNSN